MKFQLAVLGLATLISQVMATPAPKSEGKEVTGKPPHRSSFTSIPQDKTFSAAKAAGEDDVLADSCYYCGSPCGGYYCCDPLPYCGYYTNPFECVCYN